MGKGLEGKTIAFGGSRKITEISTLIEKQGGLPVIRPLQGTVFLAEETVAPDIRKFVNQGADWVIFTTGLGTETLVNIADKLGLRENFLEKIRQAHVASRGYKTLAALKKLGVSPVAVDEDGTSKGLMRSLEKYSFLDKKVMIQLHGETAPVLTQYFEDKGAEVFKILPYQHVAPEHETVLKLSGEIANRNVAAVCFTTAIQVRSLFDFARSHGLIDRITEAFREDVLAVAVGKVTAEALHEEGIDRLLAPEKERIGSMIIELARYYENRA